ncbi:MAG TPA: beta-ketoacyl synthase N-terminal-like domain-containing protein, partial [Verrucomicrobiae bacterium]|nr:beta-ketoacyl synthase N-terminal-like domain-containing protein [Verrucomicrobiae bacterium]
DLDYSAHRYAARLDFGWELQQALKNSGRAWSGTKFAELRDKLQEKICPAAGAESVAGGVANLVANRLSAVWHFNGASFSIFSHENSVFKALELARFFLEVDGADAVVVGGIDMAGGWERTLWEQEFHPPNTSTDRFAFSRESNGWSVGEGAGAVVLTTEEFAKKRGLRAYSTLRSLETRQGVSGNRVGPAPSAADVSKVARQALAAAGLAPSDVGLVEAHASGIADEDLAEIDGLADVYTRAAGSPACVLGSAKTVAGHLFAASGIASLIKVSLALHHDYRPGTRWRGPKHPATFENSNFLIPAVTGAWPENKPRFAAINSLGADGSCAHAVFAAGFPFSEYFRPPPPEPVLPRLPKVLKTGPKRIGNRRLRDPAPRAKISPESADTSPLEAHRRKHRELAARAQENTMRGHGLYLAALGTGFPEPRASVRPKSLVWNYDQILELATGRLAAVLGPAYAEADSFPVRMRPPAPPFLFVSRVTRLTARPRQLESFVMEWEFDLPEDAWFASHGVPSTLVFSESSHALILGLLYVGDPLFLGRDTRFRVLDATSSFFGEPPGLGRTFTGRSTVTSFLKTGRAILFRYTYECFYQGVCFFRSQSQAGMFHQEDLRQSGDRSLVWPRALNEWTPLPLSRLSNKDSFDESDIEALQRGDFRACFGSGEPFQKPSLLAPPRLLLVKRVRDIDLRGGRWHQGFIAGEWDVDPNHWIFPAHFPDDPLMPATLLIEACLQTALFFMYDLGFLRSFQNFKLAVVPDLPVKAKFRGAVRPEPGLLRFCLHLKRIEAVPHHQLRFDAEIVLQGRVIGLIENLALRLAPAT